MKFGKQRFMIMDEEPNAGGGGGTPPPAATPPAATPPATPPAAPAPTDWTSGLNDEFKGYVQTKGFKDPSMVLDSYKNLEKLMGAPRERLMTIPEKEDDTAGWDGIYNRLGRPATAADYKFEVDPNAVTPEAAEFLRGEFHKLGLSKRQGEQLMTKYGEHFASEVTKSQEQLQATLTSQQNSLKKEWGAAHEQNLQTAKSAAIAFKLDAGKIDALEAALGYDGVMKLLHDFGTKIGPHQFVGGEKGTGGFNGPLTPAAAQSQISALRGDPEFVKKYTSGDAEARAKMERLHVMAYPSQE